MMPMKTVAVTGVTGYIGGQVAFDLLQRGYRVHGTVRHNSSSGDRLAHLTQHPKAKFNLHIFEADLLADGSFDEAFSNCDAVLHVASPFSFQVADPERDLLRPAVSGTINVLRSAAKSGVRKVILTSSFAGIQSKAAKDHGMYLHTEDDWNNWATPQYMPYSCSKTAAERAAWDFVAKDDVDIDLVTINPVGVFGPALSRYMMSETMQMLVDIVGGSYFGIFDFSMPVVDVRDVSLAHILALENDNANGRYLCSADTGEKLTFIKDFTAAAKKMGHQPPERDLTSPIATRLMKLASYFLPGQKGQVIRSIVGSHFYCSNEKIVRELGISFRRVDDTLAESFDSLVKFGHLPPGNSPSRGADS